MAVFRYYGSVLQTESVFLGERVAAALRWLVLLALGLLLAAEGAASASVLILLGLGALGNLALSISLTFGKRVKHQGLYCLIIDSGLALGLFYIGGTLQGPLVWAGLLPVVCAALVFRLTGGLMASIATVAAFSAMALIDVPPIEIPAGMLLPATVFVVVGAGLGFLSQQLYIQLKQSSDLELGEEIERRQRERERAEALAEITSTLNASLVFEHVLDAALDLSGRLMVEPAHGPFGLVSCILLFQEGGLKIATARRLAAGDMERTLPGAEGALQEVLETGEARLVDKPSKDPELLAISGLISSETAYIAPLRAGLDLFGAMVFGHQQSDFFDESRREILDIVARQVMVALHNAQLYEALNEEKERISGIQEQARHQLARNLHDGPTQSVAAIAMRVNLARRLLGRDPEAAAEELYKVEDLARRTTKEIRHMLFTLRPQALENGGLVAALKDLARQTEDSYDQKVVLEADPGSVRRMDLGRQGALFYIVAEAVTNARKHAQSEQIVVRVQQAESDVVLVEILDEGVGFDLQEAEIKRQASGSLGLLTLRERVELINGLMRIESQKGRGTRVRVWAPLTEGAADRLRRG